MMVKVSFVLIEIFVFCFDSALEGLGVDVADIEFK